MAEAAVRVRRLALHPGNLPRWTIAQPETGRDHIMATNHKSPAAVRVLVATDRLVVGDGDTVGPLCVPTALLGQEGSGANPGEVTGQGERTAITATREAAGFFGETIHCIVVVQTYMRGNPDEFDT